MNHKINFLLYCLIMVSNLYATQVPGYSFFQPSGVKEDSPHKRELVVAYYCRDYNVPQEICSWILHILYTSYFEYKNKRLTGDLSDLNLSFFDLRGCSFQVNLTNTSLDRVCLIGTTCNYHKAFEWYRKKKDKSWDDLKQDLRVNLINIDMFYLTLIDDADKARLLLIASGFSQVLSYENTSIDSWLQVQYWSSCLLEFKNNLLTKELQWFTENAKSYEPHECFYEKIKWPYRNIQGSYVDLHCFYEKSLEMFLPYCWSTRYQKAKNDTGQIKKRSTFDSYLKEFHCGVEKYCYYPFKEHKKL